MDEPNVSSYFHFFWAVICAGIDPIAQIIRIGVKNLFNLKAFKVFIVFLTVKTCGKNTLFLVDGEILIKFA